MIKMLIDFYINNEKIISLIKDIILIVTYIYSVIKISAFIREKKYVDKKEEVNYSLKIREDLENSLQNYFADYEPEIKKGIGRDVCLRTIYVKNFPYNLEDDAYKVHLYYYRGINTDIPTGYSSRGGIYVYEPLWIYSESLYYNKKTKNWFVDKEGLKYRKYDELRNIKQLVYRIPYINIVNYDFEYDGSFYEPILYTKYKKYNSKFYANEILGTDKSIPNYPKEQIELKMSNQTHKIRIFIKNRIISKIKTFIKFKILKK